MDREYSSADAKARFSEVLRAVMAGDRVVIRYRGKAVAQITPVAEPSATLAERLVDLERAGVVAAASAPAVSLKPVADLPGALGRFLVDRD